MTDRLIAWLSVEAEGREVFKLIFLSVLAYFLVSTVSVNILQMAGVDLTLGSASGGPATYAYWLLPVAIFYFAAQEEIIFRLPLFFVASVLGPNRVTLICALFSSVLFGLSHGGWLGIFIQGFAGIFWSILFLKCGGAHKKVLKPLLVSTTAHFLFNGFVFIIVFLQARLAMY